MSIKAGNGSIGSNYIGQIYVSGNPKLSRIFTESFEESLNFVDSKISRPIKSFLEGIVLADSFAKVGTFLKSLVEALSLSDSKRVVVATTKTESISLSDSFTTLLQVVRSFVESIVLSDSIKKATSKVAFVESVILEDIETIRKVFVLAFSEVMTFFEEFAIDLDHHFIRVFTEIIGIRDDMSRRLDKLISLIDSISLSDVVAKVLPIKLLSDTFNLTDTVKKGVGKSLLESIYIVDSFIKDTTTSFLEGINLTDAITTFKIKIRVFVESIVLSEDFGIVKAFARVLTDSIVLADSFVKSFARVLAEALGLSDSGSGVVGRSFVESIILSQTVVKSVNILVEDIVALRDGLVRRWNGMLINWDKRKQEIVDWTKRVRQTVATTKVSRLIESWTKRTRSEDTYTKVTKGESDWTKLRGEK